MAGTATIDVPGDLQAAHDAVWSVARSANTLLDVIGETKRGPDSMYEPRDAASAVEDLYKALGKACDPMGPVELEFVDAFDEPAYLGQRSAASFHKLAFDTAAEIFDSVWRATDRDEFQKFTTDREAILRLETIAANWWKVNDLSFPSITGEFLDMLSKELVRAAVKRRNAANTTAANSPAQTDNKTDNAKISKKYLPPMNDDAWTISRKINETAIDGDKITQKQAIKDHIENNPNCEFSADYLERVLTANRGLWKNRPTKNRQRQKI
jgi:hypothetical protein